MPSSGLCEHHTCAVHTHVQHSTHIQQKLRWTVLAAWKGTEAGGGARPHPPLPGARIPEPFQQLIIKPPRATGGPRLRWGPDTCGSPPAPSSHLSLMHPVLRSEANSGGGCPPNYPGVHAWPSPGSWGPLGGDWKIQLPALVLRTRVKRGRSHIPSAIREVR